MFDQRGVEPPRVAAGRRQEHLVDHHATEMNGNVGVLGKLMVIVPMPDHSHVDATHVNSLNPFRLQRDLFLEFCDVRLAVSVCAENPNDHAQVVDSAVRARIVDLFVQVQVDKPFSLGRLDLTKPTGAA